MQAVNAQPYRSPCRAGLKSGLLASALGEASASFAMRRLRRYGPLTAKERAGWLHDGSRILLRRIGVEVAATGDPPLDGLVVSNHLSYLDVLAYASLFPCLFVSKQEVRGWPVFGRLATMAGTIYVDRERSADNRQATSIMEQALRAQVPVILFPEGTSTDGSVLLPFRSPFFEPAVRSDAMVSAAAIGYASQTAREADLAYYGDAVFGPHLLRTLGQREVRVQVAFADAGRRYTDRKHAARTTQAEVEVLRAYLAGHAVARPEGCTPHGADHLTLAG